MTYEASYKGRALGSCGHAQSRRRPAVPLTAVTLVLRPCAHLGEARGGVAPCHLQPTAPAGRLARVDLEGGSYLTSTDHTESIGPFENPM